MHDSDIKDSPALHKHGTAECCTAVLYIALHDSAHCAINSRILLCRILHCTVHSALNYVSYVHHTVKSCYNLLSAELQCILIILQSSAIEKTSLLRSSCSFRSFLGTRSPLLCTLTLPSICPPTTQTPACTNCRICTATFALRRLCRLHILHILHRYLQTCTHIANLHTYLQTSASHICKLAHSFSRIRLIWSTSYFVTPMHVLFCIGYSTVCAIMS